MVLSVMGLLPVLSEVRQTPNINTGQTHPVTAQTAPLAATHYRESGLVRWLQADIQSPEIDFRFAPESRRFRDRH